MASPAFEVGRSSETEVLLSRLLEKTLRRSSAVNTESLCLIAGQKVWSIRADVHLLSADGNLIDSSCIAVIAASQHFRRLDTSIEGDTVKVHTLSEREPVPLSLLHFPYCITFSFYNVDGVEIVLLDTVLQEEQLREGCITISVNCHGEICQTELLKALIIAYFDPTTRDNQEVRQALSYFLPVYCYSLRENQDRMRSVAVDVMHSLFNMHEALDGTAKIPRWST